jgi:hypothetical protein
MLTVRMFSFVDLVFRVLLCARIAVICCPCQSGLVPCPLPSLPARPQSISFMAVVFVIMDLFAPALPSLGARTLRFVGGGEQPRLALEVFEPRHTRCFRLPAYPRVCMC